MLSSISWQEFITAILVVTLVYYTIASLVFYRQEIASFFKHGIFSFKSDDPGNAAHSRESGVMGVLRYENWNTRRPTEEKTEIDQITSAPLKEPEEEIAMSTAADPLIRSVATLLEEIATLSELISKSDKSEVATFFRALLSNYSHLAGTIHQERITQFIHDSCKTHCAFSLDMDEVNAWWNNQ